MKAVKMGIPQWKLAFEYCIWKYRRHMKNIETGIDTGTLKARSPNSIFSSTCADVFHYRAAGYRDFIPRLDCFGAWRERANVFDLPSHSQASSLDHEFMSPTYKEVISFHIKKFMREYGEKK